MQPKISVRKMPGHDTAKANEFNATYRQEIGCATKAGTSRAFSHKTFTNRLLWGGIDNSFNHNHQAASAPTEQNVPFQPFAMIAQM
jgi:hypothetical protein